MRPLLFTAVVTTLAAPAFAQPQPDAGTKVYDQVLKSCVWIVSDRGGGRAATGSGSLIDRQRQLVLTNYHVVGDVRDAVVYFPAYRGTEAIAEKDYYRQQRGLAIRGRVVNADRRRDLAVIKLESVPTGAVALPLAHEPARPGQPVHSIGNPGDSGALWVYTPGKVRQVYQKQWQAEVDSKVLTFAAKVVETDSATNPGDSGGPLCNDKGELIAVTEGGSVKAKLISTFVDVSEVKTFLGTPDSRSIEVHPSQAAKRRDPLTVKDGGKFFTDEARTEVDQALAGVHHRYGFDLLVETFAAVPEADRAEVKAMSAGKKTDYYRKWAQERQRAERVDGGVILVTREPTFLFVYVPETGPIASKDKELDDAIRGVLVEQFKQKKYDDGLREAARVLRERLAKLKPA